MIRRVALMLAVCLGINGCTEKQETQEVRTVSLDGFQQVNERPHTKLQPLDYDDCQWTEGFWADKFKLGYESVLKSTWEGLNHPDNSASFRNFRIAQGLEEGKLARTFWGDGDCYKWMEAASRYYGVTKDKKLLQRLDSMIELVARTQEPDGYIHTHVQANDLTRWTVKIHHEDYNFGHLFTAATVHHEITGQTNFLEIALKAADLVIDTYNEAPDKFKHFGWNPSHIMGFVDLYEVTGDKKYLEIADTFMTLKGQNPEDFKKEIDGEDYFHRNGYDQNQDGVPLREETMAMGHAVTGFYLYAGAADIYAYTGDEQILKALQKIEEDVITHKMYITGAATALYKGQSKRRHKVSEAFGVEYQLPNANAYNETCSNIAHSMFGWRMFNLTGDATYADAMERVIYNSMLSAVSADGRKFFYANTLRYSGCDLHWNGAGGQRIPNRTFILNCYCCPPQVARSIAWIHQWAYSKSSDAIWVNIYSGNTLDTELEIGEVALTQVSNYPWDGKVELMIDKAPENDMGIMLRIPGWITNPDKVSLSVNAKMQKTTVSPGTYLELKRTWKPGDKIELNLPLQPQLIEANHEVEEVRNQVAVQRGPVVYCVENHDIPEGTDMSQLYLPSDIVFKENYESDFLGGIVTLEGEAIIKSRKDWSNKLYQPVMQKVVQRASIKMIPYYAWSNRGVEQMSVWLPVDWR